MRKKPLVFLLLAAGLLAAIAFITSPRPALAQCGSSASSCKNCHEVKKQDPVNTQGAWHTEYVHWPISWRLWAVARRTRNSSSLV